MSATKRPSTSSLRRFITSRPYVTVAELRRRFGLDDPDGIGHLERNGTAAWIGLPEREAAKIQDLWQRDEVGLELSVEVRAPVVVGIYPMRIARYAMDSMSAGSTNGHAPSHGPNGATPVNGGNGRFPPRGERPHGPPAPGPAPSEAPSHLQAGQHPSE
ncbi:MAG TPA: hypothetical protein VK736_11330 [Candidatus Binatia bacterium]|nr:hypothetical protein [Candidatus Binatia bacterium]